MLNPDHDARLKELIDLIEKERNPDKITEWIVELNDLLGVQKKPPSETLPE